MLTAIKGARQEARRRPEGCLLATLRRAYNDDLSEKTAGVLMASMRLGVEAVFPSDTRKASGPGGLLA